MLRISGLNTFHSHIHVLRNISFRVEPGQMVAIIGANGAGKSTLLGTLASLYTPRDGEVAIQGEVIKKYSPDNMVKKGISLIPERRQVFDGLTVMDNLLLGAYHRYSRDRKTINREAEETLELFPALKGKEGEYAGNLSGGLQQMVAIGRGVMAKPKVLLLDEPSVGLAPLVVKEIMGILKSLKERGTTIVLVEQNAKAALKVADRAYVMERGEMILEGTAADLLKDPRVEHAYLGKGYNLAEKIS